MNSFKIDNAESVIYEGVAGGTPIGGKGGIQSGIDTVAVSGDACNAIGALARTAGGELLVCEDTVTITDQSCSRFTPGALSISSTGQLHVCMN